MTRRYIFIKPDHSVIAFTQLSNTIVCVIYTYMILNILFNAKSIKLGRELNPKTHKVLSIKQRQRNIYPN